MEHNNNGASNGNKKDLFNSDLFKNIFNEVLGKANTGQILNNSILKNTTQHFNSSVISRFFNLIKDIINITTSNSSSNNTSDLSMDNIIKKIKNESLIYKNISNDYSTKIITNLTNSNNTNEIITHIIKNSNINDIKTHITYNNSINAIITHKINNHSVNESIMHHNNISTKGIITHNINKHVINKTKILVNPKQNNIIINKNNNNYSDDSNISTILGIGLPILITIVLILIYFIKKKIKKK